MAKKELIICSAGLKPGHLTLETAAALKTCRSVFTTLTSPAVHDLVRNFCAEVVAREPASPADTAEAALAQLKKGSPMAFLTYGNPFFLNRPAVELRRRAEAAGVKVRVLEGISSVDSLFNGLRFAEEGGYDLRLVNVGEYDRHPRISNDAETLYFMVGGAVPGRHADNIAAFLKDLRKLYPASFPVVLANSPDGRLPEGRITETTVGGLEKALRTADQATTLYVGRLKSRRRS